MGAVSATGGSPGELVERLLSDVFGAPMTIGRSERIEPWFVVRCTVEDPPSGVPVTVIVKSLREHPDNFRTDPAQVATEIAALRFLEGLGLDLAPRVLAADDAAGVIVLEDLHPRVPLPGVLIDGDPIEGMQGLVAFCQTLGSLGAATAGLDASFQAPVVPSPEDLDLDPWKHTLRSVEAFGVPAADGVSKDIAAMFEELSDPGGFLAMSNGDAGTNNFLVAPGLDGKLIDFEFARFRHALMDAVHIHVQSPQWITLPDPRPLEEAYRQALAAAVPEAADDLRFDTGLTAACMSYALVRLRRLEKVASRRPGELSRLQLVATLESAARVSEERGSLRELGGWYATVAAAIRMAWPDTDVDLNRLPKFLSRDVRSERIIVDVRKATDGA
jgi:hypothetical protein